MSIIYNFQKPDGTRVQCLQAGQNTVYMKNGRPGLVRVVIGDHLGGTHMTCLVHQDVLESKIPILKPLLGYMLHNPNLLTSNAIHYRHARPIMLRYLIDALYIDSYMLHRPFDPQGLKQAVNANGLILHMDMFRVARRLKFDQVELEAKKQLMRLISLLGPSADPNSGFIEALIWLYSNLDPGDSTCFLLLACPWSEILWTANAQQHSQCSTNNTALQV